MLVRPRLETASSPTLAAYAFSPGILNRPVVKEEVRNHDAQPSRPCKRLRLKSDVDGESSGDLQIKKRRLRRYLITSRLSKPYAFPTTYIAGADNMKLVSCGRTSGSSRNAMRKFALLNLVRQRVSWVTRPPGTSSVLLNPKAKTENSPFEQSTRNLIEESAQRSSAGTYDPLGLSDYAALDLESNIYVDDAWVDCEDGMLDVEYDWNEADKIAYESSGGPSEETGSPGSFYFSESSGSTTNGFDSLK